MKTIFRSFFTLSVLVLVAGGLLAEEGQQDKDKTEEQTETTARVRPSDYVFKAIKIEPSAVDGTYTGRFRFINRQSKQVRVSGFEKPEIGRAHV